ncbi:DNA-directed RNA polymerase subunit beta [Candidatus Wirthbacteria bacterium CG2_30_54_11]|uniref:DNA-directed RNA polymerase subunit beta n=1 Tax=Candidatus Wirthbacteria bacterium CG2_30_54_11 TaxID=1817892 RepID=A0A1J5IV25_9BACT|nr:MAG: DNA-directed RNA polymerase subunit beta [Candidatus Wirthbacteria bacterium CG2_30_54_11]
MEEYVSKKTKRVFFSKNPAAMDSPNLVKIQLDSFNWFVTEGLKELFQEISPIEDFTGKNFELHFQNHHFEPSKISVEEAKEKGATFACPLTVDVRLVNKETGEIKEQNLFFGDMPWMTEKGTFVINGAERVVVSQLIRSPGVFFALKTDSSVGRDLASAKVIPDRGAWLEFETNRSDVITVKVDRKRKIVMTTLLRALGYGTTDEILDLFRDLDTDPGHQFIKSTLDKDPASNYSEGLIEVYRRLRPGDPPTEDGSKQFIDNLFFNFRRYDLGEVGRFKANQRLAQTIPVDIGHRILSPNDFVTIVKELIRVNNLQSFPDDIDHLGNRRVRRCGELVKNQFRIGLLRVERIVKERMSIIEAEKIAPNLLLNVKPIVAILREFFGSSQLSQFMDQTNPLAELAHKRRLSAMGPGGLSRERAGFEVRDVHHSHYGRICPIETPEGPNIGLIGSLSTYAEINKYGFIETPYRLVRKVKPNDGASAVGRRAGDDIIDPKTEKAIVTLGTVITEADAKKIAKLKGLTDVPVWPFVETDIKPYSLSNTEIKYFDAITEEKFTIAQANAKVDDLGQFTEETVEARCGSSFIMQPVAGIDYMDVSPKQIVGMTSALIPFLEHNDANRALMGANMQRQAVPLLKPEAPVVGTGMESKAANDSALLCLCEEDGEVIEVRSDSITVKEKGDKKRSYHLYKFKRSNQGTCINQRLLVDVGDKVKKGQAMTDSYSTEGAEIALGQNVTVAFMPWDGYNFEDAIILNERLVREDKFTSVHIEKFEVEVRDTKLGVEEVTRDIPNVGDDALRNLDESGIIRIGAEVGPGDILVGKITPKGETELTPEERLLRAIFGEKVREVKDTSLRIPHGYRGKILSINVLDKDQGDELAPGIVKVIDVYVAQLRPVVVGDKLAGRHGNKGVISRILPRADMPYLADGTPVDIVLSPLGVPSRMNLGQVFETHLGWAAKALGYRVASPVFDGVHEDQINDLLKRVGLPEDGKVHLYDGRTGKKTENKVVVGEIYMMKLHHLAEDKIHARSVGPYSLVTQQPLGGKAQFGGQRFGEMEVWALEAYGAAHMLQEMLTIKSDDVTGRIKSYEAIIKGEEIEKTGVPESFGVLVKELQGIGLNVELKNLATGEMTPAEGAVEGEIEDAPRFSVDDDMVGEEFKMADEKVEKVTAADDAPDTDTPDQAV